MLRFAASTPEQLDEVSDLVHDAHFDAEDLHRDDRNKLLRLPFAQEGSPWPSMPQKTFVRRTWLFTEYRVPLLRGCLTVHHVVDVDVDEDWDGALIGVEYDAKRQQVKLFSTMGPLLATVSALDVEAELSEEIASYLQRRAGRFFPGVLDRPWD